MMLLPKATKTSLVKLVRSKGYDVPSIRQVWFSQNGRSRSYTIRWEDDMGKPHRAWYSAAGGRPVLIMDKAVLDLTMVEVIHFGMVEEKEVVS